MSFFVGLIFGLAVGLALIVGFVKSENARSKLRSELVSRYLSYFDVNYVVLTIKLASLCFWFLGFG
jgi:hypothetical protein